jgi:hypothetical protein
MAGAVYPSDARAGLELGHAVALRVLEHAKTHDATGWEGFRRAETLGESGVPR